jgi:hypothetical protein
LTKNSLCVLRVFRGGLRDPYEGAIRGFTKNTTEDTKDTKEAILYLEIISPEMVEFVAIREIRG